MKKTLTVAGFLSGLAFGAVLMGGLAWLGSTFFLLHYFEHRPGREQRVPITVVREDFSPGHVLHFEDLQQRSVPPSLATASMVLPDDVSWLLDKPLVVPMAKGEPLLWSDVAVAKGPRGASRLANLCAGAAIGARADSLENSEAEIRSRIEAAR